jgi:hypothetical protein
MEVHITLVLRVRHACKRVTEARFSWSLKVYTELWEIKGNVATLVRNKISSENLICSSYLAR